MGNVYRFEELPVLMGAVVGYVVLVLVLLGWIVFVWVLT